jgi:hypothetical protein
MFSKDQLNVAFTTTEGHNLMCTGNEAAAHEVALDEEYIFKAYDDTPAGRGAYPPGMSTESVEKKGASSNYGLIPSANFRLQRPRLHG